MFFLDLDRFGEKIAFIADGSSIDYAQLERMVVAFCKQLPTQKQLIAFVMRRSVEDIVAYLACLQMGHSVLMIDPSRTQAQKEHLFDRYKPNFIYDGFLKAYYQKSHDIYDALALLLPTSGSTGSSKYVRLCVENLQANCDSILAYLPIGSDDRSISSLPLYYSYGLSILHTHLQAGASIVLSEASPMQKEFWELFANYKVTNFNGVPYHYEILKKLRFQSKKYPSLRFLTQAGGKLHKNLVEHFAKDAIANKKLFFVMYGQTEATARMSYLPPQQTLQKPSSIGIAIPNTRLRLENNELVFYGKNVMLGYANDHNDLAKEDELCGKLRTGDLGYEDDEGYFYITGRAKRFIKLFGNRINLDEIEQRLKQSVSEIVVTGKDDKLVVWMLQERSKEIEDILKNEFLLHHSGFTCKLCNEFFYTPSGKVDYKRFEELA